MIDWYLHNLSDIHFEWFYLDTFYQKIFWSLSYVHSTLLKAMYHNLVKEHSPPTFGPTYHIGSKFTQISIHSTACVLCSKLRVTNHVEQGHKCHTQRPETLRFTSESSKVITREFCVDRGFPHNLRICAISRLCCTLLESWDCVQISRERNLEIAQILRLRGTEVFNVAHTVSYTAMLIVTWCHSECYVSSELDFEAAGVCLSNYICCEASSCCNYNMGIRLWINAKTLKRAPIPRFDRLVGAPPMGLLHKSMVFGMFGN